MFKLTQGWMLLTDNFEIVEKLLIFGNSVCMFNLRTLEASDNVL